MGQFWYIIWNKIANFHVVSRSAIFYVHAHQQKLCCYTSIYLLRKNEPALQIVVASLLPKKGIHRAEICILFGTMHSLCCHHRILVLGVMFFFAASCSGTPIKYNRLKCNLPLHTCPYRTAPTDLLRLRLTAQEAAGILYLFPKL